MKLLLFVTFSFAILVNALQQPPKAGSPRPVVLWHGMGDTCCYSFSMGAIKKEIQKKLPGTFVYSVMIGPDMITDEIEGFISNVDDQVDFVCKHVKTLPELANGFNAVGFSQGGQFLRGYIERCNSPPVHNFITMGGQHEGVADIPSCTSLNTTICTIIEEALALGAYNSLAQDIVVQAQYFKDPMKIPDYIEYSGYIADINNIRKTKNPLYKKNLITLNKFAMFMFEYDTVVIPKESEHFGFYEDGSTSKIIPMKERAIYKEDWIGLQELDKAGKLSFGGVPGNHMQFTLEWFDKNVIEPLLNNTIS